MGEPLTSSNSRGVSHSLLLKHTSQPPSTERDSPRKKCHDAGGKCKSYAVMDQEKRHTILKQPKTPSTSSPFERTINQRTTGFAVLNGWLYELYHESPGGKRKNEGEFWFSKDFLMLTQHFQLQPSKLVTRLDHSRCN